LTADFAAARISIKLAFGASAVGIGHPYIYGLTVFGQEGVERVLDILRAVMTMRQCGTPTLAQITRASIAVGSPTVLILEKARLTFEL
jgi:isopentenyl diphosphate isomerase/L-lactate dehydrogenase-like FMN-dependent dehydrogenase